MYYFEFGPVRGKMMITMDNSEAIGEEIQFTVEEAKELLASLQEALNDAAEGKGLV